MKKHVEDLIAALAAELAADPKNRSPALPTIVFGELSSRHPDVVDYIKRYKPGVDPYQVVASYVLSTYWDPS